ncbi:MAG: type I glyceraldehyde-3-phosphate dehydrogenase [Candidatus Zambryskibacteria bacterium CG10_big_fil_rev_8_21_14_0_10_42_12]|uniref:Type I glyceraldehyde-3-phosphate dehydrogenase n=1 Tax=Candidatus Zambryskibacteria bacterium CG10_big_fil_rev_8_21_14_0_10_42_12 TaxID=1975115 RepID=A0A2H0QWH2_9BACT|nr:MAG: type I glyceraldehyde-3-phosphate dehydrogenase [Candidatus Zambryskibacteria bacterium CG10_big_fil_rev_8_21_14_0_10_42_12]
MKKTRVAINGAGRIGRAFLKAALTRDELEVVAVNDLGSIDNIAYLIKYDTVYGKSPFSVEVSGGNLVVDGKEIKFVSEPDPVKLPWGDLDIDVVVESTGVFTTYEKAEAHKTAGAKRVVISAPVKDEPRNESEATILIGVNDEKLKTCTITSNASCTTNAGSPLMQILHEALGIEKALLNTVHAYTSTQAIVDGPAKKDMRKGRAAAQNIIPTSTGAAIATTKAIPELTGLFDGIAMRVPVPAGSIVDVTFVSKKDTTRDEVNDILRKAATEERWKPVFTATDEPIVSSDIIGEKYASIADLSMTRVVGGNLVKVLAWYDNEMGYTYALIEHVVRLGSYI